MDIHHEPGYLPESIDQTIKALAVADLGLVNWADSLFVINTIKEEQTGPVNRPAGSVILVPATPQLLLEMATKAAIHKKYDARAKDWRVINCPAIVANGIVARGHWAELPTLTGIVEAATISLSGEEISAPGHHKGTGLYVATDKRLPLMHGKAGRSKAQEGLKTIEHLLRGFTFVSEADKSAAISAVMTALLRRLLPSAPMFGITAPTPGTGKTLLAEAIAIISTGRRPPVMSMGSDENELAKRLNGVLLAGDSILLIDNITRPIGKEDVINQLLSQPVLRFRPLGGSGMVSAPTNLTVIITGNNLAIIGDAKRRTVLIRMDAGQERPEQREFDWDVIADARQHRDKLIRAALEITKFYFEVGKPKIDGWKPYGSFADWDAMVRRPLMYLGKPDPILSADALREQDPELEAMRLMLVSIHDAYGDAEVTAATIIKDGLSRTIGGGDYAMEDLHEALELVCGGRIDPRRLGHWLRSHVNRITDGLQLQRGRDDSHAKVARWKVAQVNR